MRFFTYLFLLFSVSVSAQELFPHNEPASNVPKGVLGVRVFGDTYREINTNRNMGAIRVMYGLTSKLSVMVTSSGSNHHYSSLPTNLATHVYVNKQHQYTYTQNIQEGVAYPYSFNGFYFFAKYRFLTLDGQNKHLRMAAYAEGSTVNQPFPHADPNLMADTKGGGGGLLITVLKNRFAASLTSGVVIPGSYKESVELVPGSSALTNVKLQYGRAVKYNLSLGYLVYPKKYESYDQININLYLELMGLSYEAAKIYQDKVLLPVQNIGLKSGNYIEIHPGIQAIIKSNLRIDFTTGFNLVNESYPRFYPIYMIGIQRYFFFK